MPAAVGTVAEPLYFTLLTVPATEPVTVADCAEPVYETGELVTERVGETEGGVVSGVGPGVGAGVGPPPLPPPDGANHGCPIAGVGGGVV